MKRTNCFRIALLALLLLLSLVSCGEKEELIGGDPLSRDTAAEESDTLPGDTDKPGDTLMAAMDFTVYDEDGKPVKLSDFIGRPVVLNFWATWCYYCVEELPDFDEAAAENPDVAFMMVNVTDGRSETMEGAMDFIRQRGFQFPVYYDLDLDAAMTYGVSGLPMTVFISADGEIVTYAVGMLTRDRLDAGIALIH